MTEPRIYTPHEYQHEGHVFLSDVPRAALWMPMGFGKTVTVLTFLKLLQRYADEGPAIIFAPKRVALSTWPTEARKWKHLQDFRVVPVIGTRAQREAALRERADAYTINYENIPWLFEHLTRLRCGWPFKNVVCDEATRLKSMRPSMQVSKLGNEFVRTGGSKRARELARVAHTEHVRRWINLTGTPAPNGLQDLWAQVWFQDAGERLGRTYTSFERRWFQWAQVGDNQFARKLTPLPFAQEQIQDRVRDICISFRAEDYFELKKPMVVPVYVDLPAKAMRHYQEMQRELFTQIAEHEIDAANAAAKSGKLLQMAAGAVWVDREKGVWTDVHDEKLQALESIIEEAAGSPVLVQYHWQPDLARILKKFPQARFLDDDPRTEDEWRAGKIPVLVAHAKSCGHGLNLQEGGHILVRYSYDWSLELWDQILERIGPMRQMQSGFDRVVREYRIIARNTIDELVIVRHETKRETQDILMEAARARK